MSKQLNIKRNVMLDSASIYLCQEKECLQLHASSSKSLNKIINTDIEMKKKILCYHCGTSWFICNLCQVRFEGSHFQVKQHFSTYHKIPSSTLTTKLSTIKKEAMSEVNCSHDCNSITSSLSFGDNDSYIDSSKVCATSKTHVAVINDVKNADMSEHDKQYFTSEIDTPGKGLQQLVSKQF